MPQKKRLGLILQGSAGWVGGAEYCKNLLKALFRLPSSTRATFELSLFGFGADLSLYQDMPAEFARAVLPYAPPPGRLWKRIAGRLAPDWFGSVNAAFLRYARQIGLDFLYPYNPLPGDNLAFRSAAWIPDFQHKYMPQFFTARELQDRETSYNHVARLTPCLVLSSEAARQDFVRFYPRHAHKTTVLRFATVPDDSWFQADPGAVAQARGLAPRFFLVANQFWQHKNHSVIFEALGILRQKNIRPLVVCTGNPVDYRRPAYQQEYQARLDALGIREQVVLLGVLPRFEQIQLMRQSLAVIQPSLFEGWSTVVEDARALGKNIVLSSIAVHQEQNPPAAVFFDPHNPGELADILADGWQRLSPGPQPDQERQARERHARRIVDYAERFVALSQGALAQSA
jgi:glycosyltransferase involved in cell wall biosynthesis